MTTQIGITRRNHDRAVRFFWGFLIAATMVSLIGNITYAVATVAWPRGPVHSCRCRAISQRQPRPPSAQFS